MRPASPVPASLKSSLRDRGSVQPGHLRLPMQARSDHHKARCLSEVLRANYVESSSAPAKCREGSRCRNSHLPAIHRVCRRPSDAGTTRHGPLRMTGREDVLLKLALFQVFAQFSHRPATNDGDVGAGSCACKSVLGHCKSICNFPATTERLDTRVRQCTQL